MLLSQRWWTQVRTGGANSARLTSIVTLLLRLSRRHMQLRIFTSNPKHCHMQLQYM
jgi:hypothetical protein